MDIGALGSSPRGTGRNAMQACVGDRIIIKGHDVGDRDRDGEILETRGAGGSPPFVVRWDDNGHETIFFPGSDAVVQHLGPEAEEHVAIDTAMRSEHEHLWRLAERVLATADALDDDANPDSLHEVYNALVHDVLAHAAAEEEVLYPSIAELLGAPDATKPMSRQHVELERLVDRLGRLRDDALVHGGAADLRGLRQTLHAVHEVLTLHLATEEELYLPLLEARLPLRRRQELATSMEEAEDRARHVAIEPAS
jgi:iron-sulfur cluster repair protein YtfE (RIC family)